MNLLIMDDAASIRKRIVELLSELEGIDTIFQCEDASMAAKLIQTHRPDVVILDIQVPPGPDLRNGIDVLKLTKKHHPQSGVIMLTNFDNSYYRKECARWGADFFFDKSNEFEQVPDAVLQIMRRAKQDAQNIDPHVA